MQHNGRDAPGRAGALAELLQAEIATHAGTPLGRGYQATVELFETPHGKVVVKRAHSGWLMGRAARRALAREHAIYARLEGVPGIPRSYGLPHDNCLILEYIPGPSLREHEMRLRDRTAFFDALRETLEAMHAAGVAHGDLKRKDNTIVGPGERPYVIDFGIACMRRPKGGLINRKWFDWMRQMDHNAWVKLKYGRKPTALSPVDRARYQPLWIENVARAVRVAWQTVTFRRLRKRRRL